MFDLLWRTVLVGVGLMLSGAVGLLVIMMIELLVDVIRDRWRHK